MNNNTEAPKVVKFGGTSLADVEQFKKVKSIVDAEESRRYVVPSAPGKRFATDDKITDMLYECFNLSEEEKPIDELFGKITERYDKIIEGLGIDLDLSKNYEQIKTAIENHAGRDFAASRGEYLSALVLSKFLGFHFIDAARVIKFKDDGTFDGETTQELLSKKLSEHYRAVVPGFYGSMSDGTPFELDKTYKVAMTSYRASGGGDLLTLGAGIDPDSLVVYDKMKDIRSLVCDYISEQGEIEPKVSTNWKFVK